MTPPSQRGLGKGLSALISEGYSQTTSASVKPSSASKDFDNSTNYLPASALRSGKFQPRSHFDEKTLEELAESIRKNGIMQPIIVRPLDKNNYEIIAGERRWRAAQIAGLKEVPVVIRDISDQVALELALVENIQRQDLTPLEEAHGYQRLMDEFGYKQEELSATVGKSRSHIANLLRLMDLPDSIKEMIEQGKLTAGHARALLNAKDPVTLALEVIRRGLNVRQTEKIASLQNPQIKSRASNTGSSRGGSSSAAYNGNTHKDPDILALEETLSENLGLKVSINDRGQNGEIVIAYSSLEQLDEILRRLGGSI
jgi:ParB family chromosome partitioning protein